MLYQVWSVMSVYERLCQLNSKKMRLGQMMPNPCLEEEDAKLNQFSSVLFWLVQVFSCYFRIGHINSC